MVFPPVSSWTVCPLLQKNKHQTVSKRGFFSLRVKLITVRRYRLCCEQIKVSFSLRVFWRPGSHYCVKSSFASQRQSLGLTLCRSVSLCDSGSGQVDIILFLTVSSWTSLFADEAVSGRLWWINRKQEGATESGGGSYLFSYSLHGFSFLWKDKNTLVKRNEYFLLSLICWITSLLVTQRKICIFCLTSNVGGLLVVFFNWNINFNNLHSKHKILNFIILFFSDPLYLKITRQLC